MYSVYTTRLSSRNRGKYCSICYTGLPVYSTAINFSTTKRNTPCTYSKWSVNFFPFTKSYIAISYGISLQRFSVFLVFPYCLFFYTHNLSRVGFISTGQCCFPLNLFFPCYFFRAITVPPKQKWKIPENSVFSFTHGYIYSIIQSCQGQYSS